MSKEKLRSLWSERVAEFRASGMGGMEWCEARLNANLELNQNSHFRLLKSEPLRPITLHALAAKLSSRSLFVFRAIRSLGTEFFGRYLEHSGIG